MEKAALELVWPTPTGLTPTGPMGPTNPSDQMRKIIMDAVVGVGVSAAFAAGSSIANNVINMVVSKRHDQQLLAAVSHYTQTPRIRPFSVDSAVLTDQKLPYSLQREDQIPDAYAVDVKMARNNLATLVQSLREVVLTSGADYSARNSGMTGAIKHNVQGAFGVKTHATRVEELSKHIRPLQLLAETSPVSNSASAHLSWLSNMNTAVSDLVLKVEEFEYDSREYGVKFSEDVQDALERWKADVASLRNNKFASKLWSDLSTQTDPAFDSTETRAILDSPQCVETIERAVSMGRIKAEDVSGLKMGKINVVRLASNSTTLFDSSMDAKCTKVTMALLSSGCYTDLARNLGEKYNHNRPIGTVKHHPFTYCDFNGQADKFERVLQYEVINRVINGTADHRDFAFEFLTGLGFPPPPPPPQRPSSSFVHIPTPHRIQPSETAQLSTAGAPGDPDRDPPGGGSSSGEWKKHGISPWNGGAIAISGLFAAEQVPKHIQTALNSTNTTPLTIQSVINSNLTLSGSNITEAVVRETVHQFEADAKLRSHWMMEMLNGFMGNDLTAHASQVFAFATTWLCLRWATQRMIESICRKANLPIPPSTMESDLAKFAYLISEFVPGVVTYYLLVVLCGMGSMGIGQYLGVLAFALPVVSILMTLLRATTTSGQSNNQVDLRNAKASIINVTQIVVDGKRRPDLEKLLQGKDVAALAIEPSDEGVDAVTDLAVRHVDQLAGEEPHDAAHMGKDAASLLVITGESEEMTASIEFEAILNPDKTSGNNTLMALLALASA